MLERHEDNRGARVLVGLASAVVLVAGMKAAGSLLSLFFLALVLAILTLPVMMWLRRRGVPSPLAILISVLVVAAGVGALLLLATQAFAEFQARYADYELRFLEIWETWEATLAAVELPVVKSMAHSAEMLLKYGSAEYRSPKRASTVSFVSGRVRSTSS